MADISLNLNPSDVGNSTYKDLLVIDSDLILTSDADPLGTNPILQNILQSLQFFLGEWFLDNTQGVPWLQQILVKNPDQSKIDAIFINIILGVPGVQQLTEYSFTPNFSNRTLTVTFRCKTIQGTIIYSGNVAPVSGGQ